MSRSRDRRRGTARNRNAVRAHARTALFVLEPLRPEGDTRCVHPYRPGQRTTPRLYFPVRVRYASALMSPAASAGFASRIFTIHPLP